MSKYRPFGDIGDVNKSIDSFKDKLDGIEKATRRKVGRAAMQHQLPAAQPGNVYQQIGGSSEVADGRSQSLHRRIAAQIVNFESRPDYTPPRIKVFLPGEIASHANGGTGDNSIAS